MPSTIKLRFYIREVISPGYGYYPLLVVRLIAGVKFRKISGVFSKNLEAIIDTGAHTSILPQYIWKELDKKIIVEKTSISGINDKPECQIPAKFGEATCILIDEECNQSREINFKAFFTQTDRVPIILGFAELLTRFKVVFDYQIKESYLEEKEH